MSDDSDEELPLDEELLFDELLEEELLFELDDEAEVELLGESSVTSSDEWLLGLPLVRDDRLSEELSLLELDELLSLLVDDDDHSPAHGRASMKPQHVGQ